MLMSLKVLLMNLKALLMSLTVLSIGLAMKLTVQLMGPIVHFLDFAVLYILYDSGILTYGR